MNTPQEKSQKELSKNGGKTELYQDKPGGVFKEGNPGRPPGTKNFDTIFKEAIIELSKRKDKGLEELFGENFTEKDIDREMVKKGILFGLKGNSNFWNSIYDRRLGKAVQPIDLDLNLDKEQKAKLDLLLDDEAEDKSNTPKDAGGEQGRESVSSE